MNKYLVTIIIIILSVISPLLATSYPSLDIQYEVENGDEIILEQEDILSFIKQWQDESINTFSDIEKELRRSLVEKNPDLEQLESLYRIQQEQFEYQKREQAFKVALSSQPFYSLSRSVSLSTPNSYDLSNNFGVGASVSKNLGTGAVATLSASQTSSLKKNSSPGSLWEWTHTPSLSLTFNQPLWIGEGLIDFNYSNKQIEQLEISSESAKLSYDKLIEALVAQGNSFLSSLQALKESRFLLGEQLLIEQTSIKDAKQDLEEGRISRNTYESRVLGINQISYSLNEIESQIEIIQNSLDTLWGRNDYPNQVIVDKELFKAIPEIIFDKQQLIKILLENDDSYAQAIGKLRSAELDAKIKSPSDAPMLSLALQLSPLYSPSGADFFTSYQELFTTSEPIFSLSIGFSASDISRSTSKLTSSLAVESILQAEIEVEKARDDVELKVEEIQRNVKGLLINLSIALYEFEQRTNDIEVERIRFTIGRANESSIKAKELSMYDSAFMVLQILRELDLIALDLRARGVDF